MDEPTSPFQQKERALKAALDELDDDDRKDPTRVNSEHAHYDTLYDAGYFHGVDLNAELSPDRLRAILLNIRKHSQIARFDSAEILRRTIAHGEKLKLIEHQLTAIKLSLRFLIGLVLGLAIAIWWRG